MRKNGFSISLKILFASISIAGTLLMLTAAFYFVSNSYEKALQKESKKFFQQSKKMAQVIIDTKVEELYKGVQNISFKSDFFEAVEKNDIAFIENSLLESMPSAANFSAFVTKNQAYSSSYLLYDTSSLLQKIKDIQTAALQNSLVFIEVEGEKKLFFLSFKAIVNEKGKVGGLYAATMEVNSANALINQIQSNTSLDHVCINYDGEKILQNNQNLLQNPLKEFDSLVLGSNTIAYKTSLEFNGIESKLSICMIQQSRMLKQQNKEIISIFTVLGIFFLVLILIFAVVIQKTVAAPVERLKEFAGSLLHTHNSLPEPHFFIKEYKQLSSYLQNLFLRVKENEQKLLLSKKEVEDEKHFQEMLFQNSTIPSVVMDAKGFRYIDCNLAALDIYKIDSKQKLLGKTPLDVSAPYQYDGTPSSQKARFYIKEAVKKGSIVFEWLHRRSDGELWDGEVHLLSFSVKQKQMIQYSLFDITQKKQAQKQIETLNATLELKVKEQTKKLRKQLQELEQKDKMLQEQAKLAAMGEMMSAIAHQWRQPLNALSINIQNLDDDFEDGLIDAEFIEEFVQKQTQMISFMSKTIDDFRNFFKTDKEKTEFYIKSVIQNVYKLLEAQLKNSNIDFTIKGEDFVIKGYQSELQQVFLNLFSNAKDAIVKKGKEGQISVELESKNKTVLFCDSGGGADEKVLEKMFEPYYTTKAPDKGTGIGLYMSRSIVVGHMGAKMSAYNTDEGLCIKMGFIT